MSTGPTTKAEARDRNRGPRVAVVAPVYRNADTLPELHRRLVAALGSRLDRLILVDDASPDASTAAIAALAAADPRVQGVSLASNVGQSRAVIAGLERARDADRVVVLDADLQDPPEAIPILIERSAGDVDVVFAGRRGAYESAGRRMTSRLFKRALSLAVGVPRDAGMFMVLHREAVDRLLELQGPPPYVLAMVGVARLRTATVPVRRSTRPSGASAYTGLRRLRVGIRGVRWAVWARRSRLASTDARARHDAGQPCYRSPFSPVPRSARRRRE